MNEAMCSLSMAVCHFVAKFVVINSTTRCQQEQTVADIHASVGIAVLSCTKNSYLCRHTQRVLSDFFRFLKLHNVHLP